jgi:hypothetical protein
MEAWSNDDLLAMKDASRATNLFRRPEIWKGI